MIETQLERCVASWCPGATGVVGAVARRSRPAIMRAIDGTDPFDPTTTALVERPCPSCPGGQPGRAGQASARWSQTRVAVDVRADRPGLLVLSQAWMDGWTATVAGHRRPVIRVDGAIQGVPVPAGAGRVVFRYEPPGLALGAGISLGTLAAMVGWAILQRRRAGARVERARVGRTARGQVARVG